MPQTQADDSGAIPILFSGFAGSTVKNVDRTRRDVQAKARRERLIAGIGRIRLRGPESRLAKLEIALDVAAATLAKSAAGFDPLFVGRPLKRAIQQQIGNPLSKLLLEGQGGVKDKVRVDFGDRGFTFGPGDVRLAV